MPDSHGLHGQNEMNSEKAPRDPRRKSYKISLAVVVLIPYPRPLIISAVKIATAASTSTDDHHPRPSPPSPPPSLSSSYRHRRQTAPHVRQCNLLRFEVSRSRVPGNTIYPIIGAGTRERRLRDVVTRKTDRRGVLYRLANSKL